MTDQRTAERPPVDQPSAEEARRRASAIAGALCGVAVVVLLVAVFLLVKASNKPADPLAASAPSTQVAPSQQAPSQQAPAEQAPPTAQQPAAVETPEGLRTKPTVVAGGATRPGSLKVTTLVQGAGPKVQSGQTIVTNYVLVQYANGKLIQSTWDMGQTVPLTVGQLIKGFDQGIVGVPVGSRVQLDIPAALAYGDHPTGGQPGGDLRFVVDVLSVK